MHAGLVRQSSDIRATSRKSKECVWSMEALASNRLLDRMNSIKSAELHTSYIAAAEFMWLKIFFMQDFADLNTGLLRYDFR